MQYLCLGGMGGLGDMAEWMGIRSRKVDLTGVDTGELIAYTQQQVEEAIQAGQQIGRGGGGTVYAAQIDEQQVAIKKVARGHLAKKGMLNEIQALRRTDNAAIIRLFGFSQRPPSLVYEHMPRGSLYEHLHVLNAEAQPLSWQRRLLIARDVAEALRHLRGLDPMILHGDLKSANVLLDGNFNAKLADFGLARKIREGDPPIPKDPKGFGTQGYYPQTDDSITIHFDIYSFGVMLVELITGRTAFDASRAEIDRDLGIWGRSLGVGEHCFELVDRNINNHYSRASMVVAFELVSDCLTGAMVTRPNPATIISKLNNAITLNNNHN